jgi:hypothetical protein
MHTPELTPEEQRDAAHELMMSPTMDKLANLSLSMPIDVNDEGELKTALASTALPLIRALDAGRIRFDDDTDSAMLHGLLVVALSIVVGGPFGKQGSRVQ